jgi:uncharacterized membrane protein YgcG/tetratricopeptide (TPR) repeat protein
MKLSVHKRLSLFSCISAALFLSLAVNQLAQTKPQTLAPTGHVNDFAGVVDEATKQRLENVLANLKLKTGIEFDIATVKTTGAQDIADFSLKLAKDWNIGAFSSAKKSLLLVLAVNEKTSLTRLSRSVQRDLPEGVLGEMGQRMHALLEAGRFSESLNTGVEYFVNSLAQKLAFSTDDFDKAPGATPASPAAANNSSNKPTDEAVPAMTTPPKGEAGPATVKAPATRNDSASARTRRSTPSINAPDDSEEVVLTLTKPLEERVVLLRTFLDTHPDSKSRVRATELLVSARAALGDERLKKGDTAGGLQQMTQAIADAPGDASERLFSGVVSQIPLNLYLRGETAAAVKAAQDIEAKFGNDAKRLVALSGFYVRTEQGAEATRLANKAVQLWPDLAEAHHGLGVALRVSLRLEEAAAEYKRALELDPNSKAARRSLADLDRAFGKAEEALPLYRQQLDADATDKAAQTGWILSLLDLARTEEGKAELDKALQADPGNFTLLAGAAYWFAAHNDSDLALTLARRAVSIEPRYTWSEIALARALLAQRQPLEAERALRFARQYGRFPTLDYELASTLVSAGLYEEAAEVLSQSFSLKDGQIETRLGGQSAARATSFIDLLAPERKASIFQSVAADTENNARLLKALLLFSDSTSQETTGGAVNEEKAIAAAKEFAAGDDAGRVHRQLYVASRLLRRGVGFQAAYELAEAARSSADAGLTVPALTLAVQADEFRAIRARAISAGGTPDIPDAPRNVLSNLLRGRIEDIGGWALFNQDKLDDAVDHLKRAVSILPQGTPAARISLWHLGVALERQDNKAEALSYFIKSYNSGEPDPVRRTLIEQLYRKVNGSLAGLEERIGPAATPVSAQTTPPENTPEKATGTSAPATSSPENTPATTPAAVTPVAAESPSPAPDSSPGPTVARASEPPGLTPQPTPTPELAPASPSPSPSPEPSATPVSSPSPDVSPAPSISTPTPSAETTPSPVKAATQPRATITITGKVKDTTASPLGNVVVVLISPQGTVLSSTTDDQGNYSFTVVPSSSTSSYRVIPSKDGLIFEPIDRVLSVVGDDVKELNFVGAPVKQSVRLR